MKDIIFHPYDKKIMMALDDKNNFMYSENKGESWKIIKKDILEFSFAKYSDNAYFSAKNRIFAVIESVDSHNEL